MVKDGWGLILHYTMPILHLLLSTIQARSTQTWLLPLWYTRSKVFQFPQGSAAMVLPLQWTTALNRPAAAGETGQMQKGCRSSFLFGWHWNRLRCRSSGGAEQRKEQGEHPSLSCDDNDLWKDRKCKERANTSQSATVPSTRTAGSRMWKSKGQELAPKGKWAYNSLRISRKHAVWLGVSRWKKILQCFVWASSKIPFQSIWWYFLFRVALKEGFYHQSYALPCFTASPLISFLYSTKKKKPTIALFQLWK